ncbi:MAG: SIMPL domain-containing protein [Gemmataceae bacterium]
MCATLLADDHADAVKRAVDDLKGLRLKGVTVTPQQSLSARLDGNAAGLPAVYVNASTLLVRVADGSPDQLAETVMKVQQEGAKLRLGGTPQVVFEKKDGWDEAVAPAVTKATQRAVQKAELLAKSAGLKPGTILAVSDGSEAPTATDDAVAYTDGELVRKVRVKVVIAATLPK